MCPVIAFQVYWADLFIFVVIMTPKMFSSEEYTVWYPHYVVGGDLTDNPSPTL
jgi:hypothetical protein